jgi:ribosomal protein L23
MSYRNKKTVIVSPVLTEKSIDRYKNLKICTFKVNKNSTKSEISKEFSDLYGIKPTSVKTVVVKSIKSKPGSFGRSKNRKYIKKAYVYINDNTLDIFDEVVNSK